VVLTSRGGWGVTEQTFSGSAAFPAREVCVLTRVMLKALRARDLPPKDSSSAFCNTAIRACQPQKFRPAPLSASALRCGLILERHSTAVFHLRKVVGPPACSGLRRHFFNLTLVAVMLE
jgi:hypothetical protein